jgi:two-component system cell cycle response regulator
MVPSLVLECLEGLRSVAAAEIGPGGELLLANEGFLRLLADRALGTDMRRCFHSPTLPALFEATPSSDGCTYDGMITLGEPTGRTRTLKGKVFSTPRGLFLLAEHDIEELERTSEATLVLNGELVQMSRELQRLNRRLRESEAKVRELAFHDPLTGLANRRQMEEVSAREFAIVQRTGTPVSIYMADIDHFKRVNDTHGHEAGDLVLKAFARVVLAETRKSDIAARFGGEEFVVMLHGAGLSGAVVVAERVRSALRGTPMAPLSQPVTASFGAAQRAAGETWDALLRRADRALYRAKRSGRDRVCTDPAADSPVSDGPGGG